MFIPEMAQFVFLPEIKEKAGTLFNILNQGLNKFIITLLKLNKCIINPYKLFSGNQKSNHSNT